jgi:hypothetical protein
VFKLKELHSRFYGIPHQIGFTARVPDLRHRLSNPTGAVDTIGNTAPHASASCWRVCQLIFNTIAPPSLFFSFRADEVQP